MNPSQATKAHDLIDQLQDLISQSVEHDIPAGAGPELDSGPAQGWLADEHGRVSFPSVDRRLKEFADQRPDLEPKIANRFYTEPAYRLATFPTDLARTRAHMALSNRFFTINGAGSNMEVFEVHAVRSNPRPGDYSVPPEARAGVTKYRYGDVLPRTVAFDWNPANDEAAALAYVDHCIAAELAPKV